MALSVGPRLEGFFAEVLPAIVTTLTERGTPEMTPIWYDYADGQIRFNGDVSRKWLHRMEQSGRATFIVVDPKNFWRWAQVYCRVVDVVEDVDGTHINHLSHRYRGTDYPASGRKTRRLAHLEITSVKGADGSPTTRWDVAR